MKTVDLTIEKIVHGGLGLGQVEGKRVLVPLVAPGERVRVTPVEEHARYMRAALVEVLEPHAARRNPPCPHFGDCGGCDLQFLPHEDQLAAKRTIVLDAFRRIGRMDVEEILQDPVPVCSEFGYRNRIRLSYAPGGSVGLVARGSNRVVSIDACLLMPAVWNEVALPWLRSLPGGDKATFRLDTEGRMIAAITGHSAVKKRIVKRMAMLEKNEPPFPGAVGILFNAKPIKGSSQFEVKIAGHRFQVGAGSFFQVNYEGAARLIETVDRILEDSTRGTLVDLYAGVGTFTAALGGRFDRVVAVEIARSAVRDFKKNIEMNEIKNVDLVEGAAEKVLSQIVSGLPADSPVTVLVDPPRTGLETGVIPSLVDLHPAHIIYVSCDPATLARDVALLAEQGYSLTSLEIMDLFPQTAHVECVAHIGLT